MKMKLLMVSVLALLTSTSFGGGKKGSCYDKAISLKSSQAVTLVPEYDSEDGEEYDNGVAYLSVTLNRGQAYTIWITGGNAANIDLDAFTNDEYYEDREDEPSAGFDVDEIDGGATKYAYLYADDWDEEDPSKGKYIVELDGEIGESTQLYFQSGIKTFSTVGTEDSPKVLSFSTGWKTLSSKMIDGEYYITASLKANRKYRVYLRKGVSGSPLTISSIEGYADTTDAPQTLVDAQYANDYNDAFIVTPSESAKYVFALDGETSQSFKFYYKMIPTRAIGSHTSIPLLPENEYSTQFVPGRIADNLNYYDEIIDEHLCRIYLNKGERWVFETVGADKPIEMRAYDPSGKMLATNESADGIDDDTRLVVTASAAGVYYVGVCDPTLESSDVPTGAPVTLTARNTADMPPPDAFDPLDDTYAGATVLKVMPAGTNQVLEADGDFWNGPHRFAANDLYDCYALSCRKGLTYSIRTSFESPETFTRLTLAAKVFYLKDGKETSQKNVTGSITPVEISREGDLTFKADISGTIYVRVWVADGKGLDYPAYNILAKVKDGDKQFGLVSFEAQGAAGTFSLNSETVKYPAGSVLTLATNANLKVVFNAPTGFTAKPASTTIAVPAYADGAEPVKVTAKFYDIYDSKYQTGTKTTTKNGKKTTTKLYSPDTGDDTTAGAFAITPAVTAATVKRTLWKEDPADHFSFTAATNIYYNLKIAGVDPVGLGDATMIVSNATAGVVFTGDELAKALLPVGKTYVIVTHAAEPKADSSYSLTYSRAAGGVVKFTASSFSVNEGTEYATLTVARTGSEGIARVRYYTEAGTAQPGTNYFPVMRGEGTVKWANGDKANKSIKVKLIPDLTAQWAASNLYFRVHLEPVDEFDLASGEYLARMGLDTAKVTIKEKSTKKPGTISLARFTNGDDAEKSVSNVKKPAVTVTAKSDKAAGGTTNTLVFARTGGTSGKVSITVKSAPLKADTAKAGTDFVSFSKTLTWEDGDAEPKEVTFVTYARSERDTVISRKFNVSMAVVRTGFTPTLSAKAATVTVANGNFTQTGAAYAKTIPAASGVKLATKGTWVVGEGRLGTLSNGSATFTLTGPGLFVCEPFLNTPEGAAGKLTYKFNKEAAVSITNADNRIVRIVGAGTTTFVVTLAGASGNVSAGFIPQENGAPYLFVPFKGTSPDWPMNKAVVTTNLNELAWTLPENLDGFPGLYTRVRFGTASKPTAVVTNCPAGVTVAKLPDPLVQNKTYYWAVDYAYTTNTAELADAEIAALKWTNGPSTWSFSTLKDGAPLTSAAGTDAAGNDIADLLKNGQPVELIQCLKPDLSLSGVGEGEGAKTANKYRLLGGSLPKGVTISAQGDLTGCPSTVGECRALLQSYNDTTKTTTNKKTGKKTTTHTYTYGTAIPVTFNVLPAGTALGSWRGPVAVTGFEYPEDSRQTGTLTLSVTSAGKLTAKAVVAGVTYTFTGTGGYDELVSRVADPEAGDFRRFRKENLKCTMTVANKKYTSYLTLEVDDGALTNSVALAKAAAKAELTLRVANAKKTSVSSDNVAYEGDLVRSNGGTAIAKTTLGAFAGYYTMGLAPMDVSASDGLPFGNGYLTLTVAADGTVKASGVLADGTSVSFSSVAVPVGDNIVDPRACAAVVPVLVSKSTWSLTGFVRIAYEEGAELPVVISASRIRWVRNASTAVTREGTGFTLELAPTGGWYNKTENMQAHYLNTAFALQGAAAEDLPEEALASGYSFAADDSVLGYLATPENLAMRFVGNTAKVDAQKLVKNKTTGLYDFAQSVNPWNATFKFTRATGIISGTFSAWEWVFKSDDVQDFATKQKEIKKLTHKGVWLYSRDSSSDSSLRDDAVSAGYFLLPTSGKWKASLPFSVIASPDEKDWIEEKDLEVGETD